MTDSTCDLPKGSLPNTASQSYLCTSTSLDTGFLVWAAAEAAAQGHSIEAIVALMEGQGHRTHVFAALNTLEFLRRGGRMNRVMAVLGSGLQMKPLLKMHDGNPTAEKTRTAKAATERLVALLQEQVSLERVALMHTHALEKAQDLRQKAQHLLPAGSPRSLAHTWDLGQSALCVSVREQRMRGEDYV